MKPQHYKVTYTTPTGRELFQLVGAVTPSHAVTLWKASVANCYKFVSVKAL